MEHQEDCNTECDCGYCSCPCHTVERVKSIFKDYEFVRSFNNNQLTFTHLYRRNDKHVMLKCDRSCSGSLEYEYLVLKKLNEIGVDWVPKIYDYIVIGDEVTDVYLLTEYIEPIQVECYDKVLMEILIILTEMNQMKITHYDLHLGNIVVSKCSPRERILKLGNIERKFRSDIKVCLIDFETMHIADIQYTKNSIGDAGYNGMVSTCFDDMYDLSILLNSITIRTGKKYMNARRIQRRNMFSLTNTGDDLLRERSEVVDYRCGTDWTDKLTINNDIETATKYKQFVLSKRKNTFDDLVSAILMDLK